MCASTDCEKCIIVEFLFVAHPSTFNPNEMHTISSTDNARLMYIDHYPKSMDRAVPEYLPERIEQMFQAPMRAHRTRDYWLAISGFRSLADVATKEFEPPLSNKKLMARINALREAGQITPAMADWAHNIRLDGNDGAHDGEPFSEEESEELMLFTETLLTYLFTMPEKVRLARERRDIRKQPDT